MFVSGLSISVQVSKKIFRVINKMGGPNKHCGEEVGLKKIQKLTSGGNVSLARKSISSYIMTL